VILREPTSRTSEFTEQPVRDFVAESRAQQTNERIKQRINLSVFEFFEDFVLALVDQRRCKQNVKRRVEPVER
jgi:hypothetical protein